MSSSSEVRLLPSNMSFTEGNVAENWRRFKQKIEFYFNALAANKLFDKKKIGILMTALGDAGIDIFNTFSEVDKSSGYEEVIKAFDKYCESRKNTIYERFLFSQLIQGLRSVDAYIVELKSQARKCDFADKEFDKLVRDRLVVGISNPKVRKEMLRDAALTLDVAVSLAKAWEKSDIEAAYTAKVSDRSFNVNRIKQKSHDRTGENVDHRKCDNCGYEHRNPRGQCPAADKECNYCLRMGHFTSVCQKSVYKPYVSGLSTSSTPDCQPLMLTTP